MMLSSGLNKLVSKPLYFILLLYVLVTMFIIAAFASIFYISPNSLSRLSDDQNFLDYIYFSSVTYFTIGYGDILPSSPLSKILVIFESITAFTLNGSLMAVIVYKLLRLEGKLFIISETIALTTQKDGKKRLEIRVYNDSNYDIVNLNIKLRLRHILATFPETPYSTMYNVILNLTDYVYLASKNYFIITSSTESKDVDKRDVYIGDDFLERYKTFELLLLIEGEFLPSGLRYSQFKVFNKLDVVPGRFRFVTKEELELKTKLVIPKFNEISDKD